MAGAGLPINGYGGGLVHFGCDCAGTREIMKHLDIKAHPLDQPIALKRQCEKNLRKGTECAIGVGSDSPVGTAGVNNPLKQNTYAKAIVKQRDGPHVEGEEPAWT